MAGGVSSESKKNEASLETWILSSARDVRAGSIRTPIWLHWLAFNLYSQLQYTSLATFLGRCLVHLGLVCWPGLEAEDPILLYLQRRVSDCLIIGVRCTNRVGEAACFRLGGHIMRLVGEGNDHGAGPVFNSTKSRKNFRPKSFQKLKEA